MKHHGIQFPGFFKQFVLLIAAMCTVAYNGVEYMSEMFA
jgi:hypothetical protein